MATPVRKLPAGKKAVYDYTHIASLSYRQLRAMVTGPAEPGFIYKCYIERQKSIFGTTYSLCADLENGSGREMIVAKKLPGNRTSHFIFSIKGEDLDLKPEMRSKLYLGKLRALNDKDYILYDSGQLKGDDSPDTGTQNFDDFMMTYASAASNASTSASGGSLLPSDDGTSVKSPTATNSQSLYRKELCLIHYEYKKRPQNDERGLEVCIPNTLSDLHSFSDVFGVNGSITNGPPPSFAGCFDKIRNQLRQNELYGDLAFVMHEKKSKYDPLSSCLVDFKGRATTPSMKNFQLITSSAVRHESKATIRHEADDKEWLFQCGKVNDSCYNLDFKHPLSMFQAFAIAVARFDANLSGKM